MQTSKYATWITQVFIQEPIENSFRVTLTLHLDFFLIRFSLVFLDRELCS